MDDIARDIAERQAVIEHNEYLVDAVKPPVQIEVHVLRELTEGTATDSQDNGHNSSPRAHFHRPYCTTLTHIPVKEDPDALFTLLRRCLPFQEWEYVDDCTTQFDPYIYLLKPGEGTESEEDEAFHMHDYAQHVYVDWEDSEPEQRMRSELRERQMGMFRQFWEPAKIHTWWFVLKARQSFGDEGC